MPSAAVSGICVHMRKKQRRNLVTVIPPGIRNVITDGTRTLIEQIYGKRKVPYRTVQKAIDGIDRDIHNRDVFDKKKTEKLLHIFREFTETIEQDSGRVKVLNHLFVGSILKKVEESGVFSKQEYMRWARARFGRGHTDQTLLNSRYIAELGEIAFRYADFGVKPVLELHYMFNSFRKKQMEDAGVTIKREPSKEDHRMFLDDFKARLEEFREIYSEYDSHDEQLTMRTAMDAAITYYRLTEEVGIPSTVVTKDHAIMIALFKGFSLEKKDALAVGGYLNRVASTDAAKAVIFDEWVANRMINAPHTFQELEHSSNPARLLELLSRFAEIPERGKSHLNKEIDELRKDSSMTKYAIHQVYEIIVYLARKLNISFDLEETAYQNFMERL